MGIASRVLTPLALAAILAAAAACDNGPSAVATNDRASSAPADDAAAAPGPARASARAGRDEDVPLVGGKPMWSANRQHTAQENAQRAFERNGEAFGAKTLDDFVGKAHAFVEHPPAGAEKLTRANGDVLLYDAGSNTFAVVSKAGAPRTMFKPDNGAAYWAAQKAREQRSQNARRDRSTGSDDNG